MVHPEARNFFGGSRRQFRQFIREKCADFIEVVELDDEVRSLVYSELS